jgi:Matrixin
MKISLQSALARIVIPLLLVGMACSVSPSLPSALSTPAGTEYRYDGLPSKTNEGSAFAEYQTISKWDTTAIKYYFLNGTDKLPGDEEKDVIRQAFGLWAAQTPLTFTETQ